MRRFIPFLQLVVVAACASSPPQTTATIPFVALDSIVIERIAPDALRIDQLILADSAIAMAARNESCAAVDEVIDEWAEGASAFNGGVALGAHLRQSGASARALHTFADAGVVLAGTTVAYLMLDQLRRPVRDFGNVKIAVGAGAFLKLLDVVLWKPAAQEARAAIDAGQRIADLASAANNLPTRINALRGQCRNSAFERQARDLRAHQLGLVTDFIDYVDMVPAQFSSRDRALMSYRQRLRWYQVRAQLAR